MSEDQDGPVDLDAELAEQLAHPPAELSARAELLDVTVNRLQVALTALDEV